MVHIGAALMVMVGHEFDLLCETAPSIMGRDIHGLGVRILFFVSGYLVCSSYCRTNNPLKYAWKRISRLYPALILCLFVTVCFMRMLTTEPNSYWQSAWTYFWHNLEMRPKYDLAGVFTDNPYPTAVNGSLWTLPIELLCYALLIPVAEIFKAIKRISKKLSMGFAFILLLIVLIGDTVKQLYFSQTNLFFWNIDLSNALSLSTWFFTGVVFYAFDMAKFCNLQAGTIICIVYLCMPPEVVYFGAPIIVGYGVLSFALSENPLFGKRIKRDICYDLYLYAFPVQQTVIFLAQKNHINLNLYLLLLGSMFINWILAEISYFVIHEKLEKIINVKCLVGAENKAYLNK